MIKKAGAQSPGFHSQSGFGLLSLIGWGRIELAITLFADLGEEVELGFEEVDMTFLVRQKLIEKLLGNIVAEFVADFAGLLVGSACVVLTCKVGFQNFLDVLADAQRSYGLQVRVTFEEDNAVNQLVCVMHFFDGFFTFLLGKTREAPVVEEAVVKPVLVYSAKLEEQCLVKPLDDLWFAFHSMNSRICRVENVHDP